MTDFRINVIVDPEKAKRGVQQVNKELDRTEQKTNRLRTLIGRAFAFGAVTVGIRQLASLADAYTTLNNRIRIVTNSAEEQAEVLDRVFKIANKARQPVGELAVLYQRVTTASKELGASQEEVLKFVDATAQALAIQGGAAAESKGALLQLSQALGNANIQAQEFNSLVDGAFPLLQAAARGIEATGGSVSKLRQLVLQGNLSNKEFFQAILSQADSLEKAFAKTTPTISQAFGVLQNNLIQFVGEADHATGISQSFSESLISLANNLDNVVKILSLAVTAFIAYKSAAAAESFIRFITTQIELTRAVAAGNAVMIKGVAADRARAASVVALAEAEVRKSTANLTSIKIEEAKTVLSLRNIKLVQSTLVAERELELVRLQAQISATGRQQSLARLAELRLAEVAIIKQVEAAERGLAASKLATATAQKKLIGATKATTAAYAAQGAVLGLVGRAWIGFTNLMKGALSILGGIPGVILTAVTAFFLFADGADESSTKLEEMDSRIIDVTNNLDKLGVSQIRLKLTEFESDVKQIEDQIKGLETKRAFIPAGILFKGVDDPGVVAAQEQDQLKRAARLETLNQDRVKALKQIEILTNRIANIEEDKIASKLSKESLAAIGGLDKITSSLEKRSAELKNNRVELIKLRIAELSLEEGTGAAEDKARKALEVFEKLTASLKAQKKAQDLAAQAQKDYNTILAQIQTPAQQIKAYSDELDKLATLTNLTEKEQAQALETFKQSLPLYQEGANLTSQYQTAQDKLNEEIGRLDKLLKAGAISQDIFNRSLKAARDIAESSPLTDEIALLKEDAILLRENGVERQILSTVLLLENDLQRKLNQAEKDELGTLIKANELLSSRAEIMDSIKGPQEELIVREQALKGLYEDEIITLDQLNTQMLKLVVAQSQLNIESGNGSFADGFIVGIERMLESARNFNVEAGMEFANFFEQTTEGFAQATADAIVFGDSLGDSLGNVARRALADLLAGLIKLGLQFILNATLGETLATAATVAGVTQAATIATAFATPAALVSLASFGANAVPAQAAIASTIALTQGLAAIGLKDGGPVVGPGTSRSDSVPAMLSNGEFVVNAKSASRNRALLEQINNSNGTSNGSADTSSSAAPSTTPSGSSEKSVRIVNVLDPGLVDNFLSSSSGERVLVNVIERNASSIKQLLA